jgi:hypothetical protein
LWWIFFQMGSRELFFWGLASNLHPPDLCFLRSWGYRHEPPASAQLQFLFFCEISHTLSTGLTTGTYTALTLFTIAKLLNQPGCPSTDGYISKEWCIYT